MGWQPSGQHVGEGEREQREHITRLWGACSCQPQPCRKARVGSAGETQSLVLARLRRAGSCPPWMLCRMCKAGWQREGRCPLQGTPHLRWISWVQTSTATHYPEERRTEQNPMFVQWRGRLRALKLARKGGELHGTASITSSSGTLFLYASLAGQRNQLWHRSPGIPCHHLHISTKIWFSFFHIHLLRDSRDWWYGCLVCKVPNTTGSLLGVQPPCVPPHPKQHPPLFAPKYSPHADLFLATSAWSEHLTPRLMPAAWTKCPKPGWLFVTAVLHQHQRPHIPPGSHVMLHVRDDTLPASCSGITATLGYPEPALPTHQHPKGTET